MKFVTKSILMLSVFCAATYIHAGPLGDIIGGVETAAEGAVQGAAQITGAAVGTVAAPVRGYYENPFVNQRGPLDPNTQEVFQAETNPQPVIMYKQRPFSDIRYPGRGYPAE